MTDVTDLVSLSPHDRHLSYTRVTDANALGGLSSLHTLDLKGTGVTYFTLLCDLTML